MPEARNSGFTPHGNLCGEPRKCPSWLRLRNLIPEGSARLDSDRNYENPATTLMVGVRPVDPWHLRPTRPTSGPNGWRVAASSTRCCATSHSLLGSGMPCGHARDGTAGSAGFERFVTLLCHCHVSLAQTIFLFAKVFFVWQIVVLNGKQFFVWMLFVKHFFCLPNTFFVCQRLFCLANTRRGLWLDGV